MSSKAVAFILLPGSFCTASVYNKLVPRLTDLGHIAKALTLKTVGEPEHGLADGEQTPGFYDDAAYVRSVIEGYADQGLDVVVAGNSYGGFVSTEAIKGMAKADRAAAGKAGGVTHLVLIASMFAAVGNSVFDSLAGKAQVATGADAGAALPDYLPIPSPPEMSDSQLKEFREMFAGVTVKPHSSRAFVEKLTYAAYMYIPATMIVPTGDIQLLPKFQVESFEAALARGAPHIRHVEMEGEHTTMLSNPDGVAKVLLEAAGEKA